MTANTLSLVILRHDNVDRVVFHTERNQRRSSLVEIVLINGGSCCNYRQGTRNSVKDTKCAGRTSSFTDAKLQVAQCSDTLPYLLFEQT